MSRINTNVASQIAQRVLSQNNQSLSRSLERLSTGLRVNRGKDDPAGLIASQNLRSEKSAITAAITNSERADQVVNIAEGGLDEVSGLLNELQGLITQSANEQGISEEEKVANQLQIDSIIQTIDRVASSTSFQGLKLLNGNFDFTTETVHGNVAAFAVNGAKLDFGDTRDVDVVVTGSAQTAGFFLSFGASNLNLGGAGPSDGNNSRFVLEVTGSKGSRELSFASGTTIASIVAAINSFTEVTGLTATLSGNTGLTSGIALKSVEFGAGEFVSVRVLSNGALNTAQAEAGIYELQAANNNASTTGTANRTTFALATNKVTDDGQDVSATINGISATTTGTVARINTDFLDVEINLKTATASSADAQRLGAITAFTITGGGADFQLAGRVDIAGKVSLGIQSVQARNLGRAVDGASTYFLADLGAGRSLNVVDGNIGNSQKVVEGAIREIASLRGRLGAFQKNTIGATIRSLGVASENTSAAESVIRDADFASETAALTRNQILASSAQQILALANAQPQAALQLLG